MLLSIGLRLLQFRRGSFKEQEVIPKNTTKVTYQIYDVASCNDTKGCRESLRNSSDPGVLYVDVNTIDYDIQHDIVNTKQLGNQVNNTSPPNLLIQRLNKANQTGRGATKKKREQEVESKFTSKAYKKQLLEKFWKGNTSRSAVVDNFSKNNPLKSHKRTSYLLLKLIKVPTSSKLKISANTKSKPTNLTLDDLITKYTVVKKRSLSEKGLRRVLRDSTLVKDLTPLKRSDRGNHDSFKFFTHESNEEPVDPVSSVFDKEFFGGTKTGLEGTTDFPVVDKDYDYNAEYEYGKEQSPSEEELRSEETYDEDEEGTYYESNGEQGSSHLKPKENSKVVINVVKQGENQESNENEEEEEDEDVDVIREPPIIVLYKGDSKQLQPSFEYTLTHGGLDPRYLTKEPLAGPLATRGFNHNFQVMRQVPVQGNGLRPNRRYPTVGGFNTTQIHAIIQTGQLTPTTMSGNNNATVGVVPVAPADHVNYGRPMDVGQFFAHPYPENRPYITRPVSSYMIRPKYYGSRGRRPPPIVRRPSTIVYATSPRYTPSYRGGHMLRYRGTGSRNHMARYRPVNVGVPRGTRVAILKRRESSVEF